MSCAAGFLRVFRNSLKGSITLDEDVDFLPMYACVHMHMFQTIVHVCEQVTATLNEIHDPVRNYFDSTDTTAIVVTK